MTKRRDPEGACVCMTAVCLLLCWVYAALSADDCERAKETYRHGVQLMNYEERREAFQRAVDFCPSYVEAHVNLAGAFENLGQFEKAEQHYRKALEHRPAYHLPYIGLVEVCLKTGRITLAKEAYEEGLATAPEVENEILRSGFSSGIE